MKTTINQTKVSIIYTSKEALNNFTIITISCTINSTFLFSF